MDKSIEVIQLIEYLTVIKKHFKSISKMVWVYRGQSNINWKLKPKAGREEYYISRNCYFKHIKTTGQDTYKEGVGAGQGFSERHWRTQHS